MFAFLNALTRTTSGKAFRVHLVCKIRGQVGAKKRKNQYSVSIAEGGSFIAQVNRDHA